MEEILERTIRIVKALANPIRIKIVLLLLRYDRLSVSEIVELIGESQSLVSHHLAVLRENGIVSVENSGKFKYRYYSINKEELSKLLSEIMMRLVDKKSRERLLDFLLSLALSKGDKKVKDESEHRSRGNRV